MYGVVFKLFSLAIAVLLILYLIGSAFRKGRSLDARIAKIKREQEAEAGKAVRDPYAELAQLYEEHSKRPSKRDKD